ncbi:YD repeat-containing protein [Saccharicrinis carchari]|uniref:YD repeat-containing protein n=1 Tax=Saccharicrinis carchari TaxID=1168039 RepID=A0A521BIA9_SACCC|nr:hypothetical protein [Saccharicrinis carchari]SMO46833.1 YD repeat-containing protein [Saccharicrinis carchari]
MYIVDEPTDNDGMYFTNIDYQGNLLALSNESGNVVERYAYDPWGNRRNPENWAEAANLDGKYQYTSQGYTLQSLPRLSGKHLDGFGIINMFSEDFGFA